MSEGGEGTGAAPRLVLVESPYAGKNPAAIRENEAYARRCLADCFQRGEFPFASHLLYTQPGILRDADPAERVLGIAAGLAWGEAAAATVVYVDRGISKGMELGVRAALLSGRPVEVRSLYSPWRESHGPADETLLRAMGVIA